MWTKHEMALLRSMFHEDLKALWKKKKKQQQLPVQNNPPVLNMHQIPPERFCLCNRGAQNRHYSAETLF